MKKMFSKINGSSSFRNLKSDIQGVILNNVEFYFLSDMHSSIFERVRSTIYSQTLKTHLSSKLLNKNN